MIPSDSLCRQLHFLEFPADLRSLLLAARSAIEGDAALRENYQRMDAAWLQKEPLPPPAHRFTPLLIALSHLPEARERHRQLAIPEEVTRETFSDLLRLSRAYLEDHGEWGFREATLLWMRHHLSGQLLQLGRLQFQFGTYSFPYRVYRHRRDGRFVALPADGEDGSADGVRGIPVDLTKATMSDQPVTLLSCDYERFLQPGDPALVIHIARGQRLDPEACDESFRKAEAFFPRFYPEFRWRVFRCLSWLLDPALEAVMRPDANIIRFGQRFHRVPIPGADDGQTIERTFGKGVDPLKAIAKNPLQERMIAYLRAGGKFTMTGGLIPRAAVKDQC